MEVYKEPEGCEERDDCERVCVELDSGEREEDYKDHIIVDAAYQVRDYLYKLEDILTGKSRYDDSRTATPNVFKESDKILSTVNGMVRNFILP